MFVPHWRLECSKDNSPITDQDILLKLQKERTLVFTPSRRINGKRIVCYDDRYIVKYAFDTDSVILSNDTFRDLQKEKPEWKTFIENRVLMFTFVSDRFMPPDDPLGRVGVNLDNFLKKTKNQNRPCPYKNYCTYGGKCRYYHPEKDKLNSTINNSSNVEMKALCDLHGEQFEVTAKGCLPSSDVNTSHSLRVTGSSSHQPRTTKQGKELATSHTMNEEIATSVLFANSEDTAQPVFEHRMYPADWEMYSQVCLH